MLYNSAMENIGIIGAGNMGEALIRGIISGGVVVKKEILVADKRKERRDYTKATYGISLSSDNVELVEKSRIIIFCVKPQDMAGILSEIKNVTADKLIISIAAGITTAFIEEHLGGEARVVRVMPNTPALVNEGFSCFAGGRFANSSDTGITEELFSALGKVMEIKEELMDVVTAISGSGPAYFFYLIEALMEVAIEKGFTKEEALKMCGATALGSAKLLESLAEMPEVLRGRVTSPGGTTEAAIEVFEKKGFKGVVKEALERAIKRSEKLRQE